MTWSIELILNTNIQRFEAWLDRYRITTLPLIVDLEKDRILQVIGAPTFRNQYQGLRVHQIEASIGQPSREDPEALESSFEFPVLEIEVFEPADTRINVTLKCKHQGMIPYHIRLLGEIAKLWPETRESILGYLNQFVPAEENKLQIIMTLPKGYKEFHIFSNRNFETLKNRLVSLLENNYFMSDTETNESIDIESKTVSSGTKGNIDYYHIYVQGQLNGTPARNLIIFELQGRFDKDLETYLAAIYLENERYLEQYINMLIQKLLPDPKNPKPVPEQPFDLSRPSGYEILADNTGGTALYKRDKQGLISDVKPLPNPGWTFEVGPKSIAIKPEHIELNHITGNYEAGLDPSSAKDSLIKHSSEALSGLTKDTNAQEAKVGLHSQMRCPKKGSKRFITWQATWRKIKGRVQQGDNYQELAKSLERTNLRASPELVADIVKAGHAGLLD